MRDYKVIVVLGNGFDLDLGLKTRYIDFIRSFHFKDILFPIKRRGRDKSKTIIGDHKYRIFISYGYGAEEKSQKMRRML